MKLRYLIPVPVKKIIKSTFYGLQDLKDKLLGNYDSKYPPRKLNYVGSHDFKKVGDEFFGHFKSLGGLQLSDSVLDIGSGVGRMALPLTEYLNSESRYFGFDIDRRGVDWCQENITPKHPKFQFEYADIYNLYYNQKGEIQPSEFNFPCANQSFDFVFATSVFTHMRWPEVVHYFTEIKRVLKPGGKIFLTFFLLNDQTKILQEEGKSNAYFAFQDDLQPASFYSHKNNPEAEIAFTETVILDLIRSTFCAEKESGESTVHIYPGFWSGRSDGVSYQDIVVIKTE